MKIKNQDHSRRAFIGKVAAATAGISLGTSKVWGAPAYIPNLFNPYKRINGVQLGLITYSFRALEDQSAEATLQYILDCGVNSIELMGSTA